jgi:RimJ/RimL family protein N-acetyltransferase
MFYAERIRLRFNERDDLPRYVVWLNDPAVRRGISAYTPMSQALEEKWFESTLERPMREQNLAIDIKDGEGWKHIGSTSFFDFSDKVRSACIGILIGETGEWNKGYGTETMVLMLKYGFGTLNLNRIWLTVLANNPGAIRAYEKAGYVHEGMQRSGSYNDGEYMDLLLMSVLRSEWSARKG